MREQRASPRVFVSYVRENLQDVTRLVAEIGAAGVDVWWDQKLRPGDRWPLVIRDNISRGDFYVACFSREYAERGRSYMNEEIVSACETLRLMPPSARWFIPVRLSECEIPDFSIGAGQRLAHVQRVDMFPKWYRGLRAIIRAVLPTDDTVPSRVWLRDACEIGSLARRCATHLLRGEDPDWHAARLGDLYLEVCAIRTEFSAELTPEQDGQLEELQNSIYRFPHCRTEEDRIRIEKARTALRDAGQRLGLYARE